MVNSLPTEVLFLLVPLAVLLATFVLGIAVARTGGGRYRLSQLVGRLGQIADDQLDTRDRLEEHLKAQERALNRLLDDRLRTFSAEVSSNLRASSQSSNASMTELRERLAVIDTAQQNITALSSEMVGLQDILSNKQARGAFGEVQLKDIVCAMLPPTAHQFQVPLSGGQRVDCLVRFPSLPGPLAVDAKFPLESYQALQKASRGAQRDQARRALTRDLKRHISEIAKKYILPGETADSALLFLPSEAIFAELHSNFREVIEESHRQRVWIVSPTTLMATLTTLRAALKDLCIMQHSSQIAGELRHLQEDITRLDARAGKLQRHFLQAEEDLRHLRVSTDKISRRAERLDASLVDGDCRNGAMSFSDSLEPDSSRPQPPRPGSQPSKQPG